MSFSAQATNLLNFSCEITINQETAIRRSTVLLLRILALDKLLLKYFHHNLRIGKYFVLGPLCSMRTKIP